MFGWFKKKKEKKDSEEYIAHAIWRVKKDGDIWLDFEWRNDEDSNAAKLFAEMFVMITGGDLVEESLEFIKKRMLEDGGKEQYESLISYMGYLQYQRAQSLYPEILSNFAENSEEQSLDPVVKPSDVINKSTNFKQD